MDKERLTALGLTALAVLYLGSGWSLKLGGLAKPGPGFLPRLVGLALLACVAVNLVRAFRRPAQAAGPAGAGPRRLAVAGLALSVFAYPLLLPWLNFTLTTLVEGRPGGRQHPHGGRPPRRRHLRHPR
jgi:hypothetical protein